MQAIILAAGMGRRLGEKTRDNTKCMVEVNGVKLIDRLLGQLAGLDLQRVIIVVGYKGKELREYIESTYLSSLTSHPSPLKIEFAENPIYDKTNNIYSLSIVKDQLQQDDTLLIESDLSGRRPPHRQLRVEGGLRLQRSGLLLQDRQHL